MLLHVQIAHKNVEGQVVVHRTNAHQVVGNIGKVSHNRVLFKCTTPRQQQERQLYTQNGCENGQSESGFSVYFIVLTAEYPVCCGSQRPGTNRKGTDGNAVARTGWPQLHIDTYKLETT